MPYINYIRNEMSKSKFLILNKLAMMEYATKNNNTSRILDNNSKASKRVYKDENI